MMELQRCRDDVALEDLTNILNRAGIAYRTVSTAPCFDLASIGSGSDAHVIVSVRDVDYAAAREAMEADCLQTALPEGHYLLTSSDEELAEIVGQASEWSAFDVAHARQLLTARGVVPELVAEKQAERMDRLETGKPAPTWLIVFGWVSTILGGVMGIAVACSLFYMKEHTPEGNYFTYDARSRRIGEHMLYTSCTIIGVGLLLWAWNLIAS